MRKIANKEILDEDARSDLRLTVKRMERSASKLADARFVAKPLATLPAPKRRIYEQVLALVYECSPNQVVAKSLVDKMLSKLC